MCYNKGKNMEPTLKTEIIETFDSLINEFSSIPEEAINIVPFEGSWTAGQLAEHVLKAIADLPQMLNEEAEPADRPADEKVAQLKSIFLDFSIKMQAPVFVAPSTGPLDKATLTNDLKKCKSGLVEAAVGLDLTAICKSFEFPTMGYFTRLEWLTFSIVHTIRHLEQLKRIHERLAVKI